MINSYTQNSKNSKNYQNYQNNQNNKNNINNIKTFFDKLFIFLKHPLFIFFLYVILIFSYIYIRINQYYKIDLLLKENINLKNLINLTGVNKKNLLKKINDCNSQSNEIYQTLLKDKNYFEDTIHTLLRYIAYLIDKHGINNLSQEILDLIIAFFPELLDFLPTDIFIINDK